MSSIFQFKDVSETPVWKEQIKDRITLRNINMKHWLENNVFSPVWWLMLIVFFAVWFVWWKLIDKTRLLEIITYGLMVTIITITLDQFGAEFVLWGYPNMLIPSVPPLFVVDLGVFPVLYMLIYQYFHKWIPFTVSMIIVSLIIAFVGEPIGVWLDMYQMNNWSHICSFPIFIVIGLLLKLIIQVIKTKQVKSI